MSEHRDSRVSAGGDTEAEWARLVEHLDQLLERLADAETQWSERIDAAAATYQPSVRNLAHYWAIRGVDLRGVQHRLANFGLSSLGRSESHVEASLRRVRAALLAMLDESWCPPAPSAVDADQGWELLTSRTAALLGPTPSMRETRIMVTLPSEAATDADLVERLVRRGMDVARINCAHDDPAAWRAMAEHVRAASAATGRSCRIAMDLAGPKLRTGPLTPGPAVVKLRPHRDAFGHVVAPGRAWFTAADGAAPAPEPGMTVVTVSGEWLTRRQAGEVLTVRDTRGATRRLQEEILWLCEAAHLPVIWATQVLEQLAKSGLPSRAEISDAALGEGAECVMLNKGAHVEDAVVVLDDILSRMAEHHCKKNALLPQLHSWYPSDTQNSVK